MKDVLALLLLLGVHMSQVRSRAVPANSNGKCFNSKTHYKLEGTNLCCNKCNPGHRLKKHCTMDSDTQCELCPRDQYLEQMNYSPNCIGCSLCKKEKGLIFLENCSPTTNSKCGCKPGMYCELGFNDPYCESCRQYKTCGVGFGVSVPGTAFRNVKCDRCPKGTFSNTVSNTDRCQPHTDCVGRGVVSQGNATADAVCEPESVVSGRKPQNTTEEPRSEIQLTTASPTTTVTDLVPKSAVDVLPSVTPLPRLTKSRNEEVSLPLLHVFGGSAAVLILLIAASVLLCRWKMAQGKDVDRTPKKMDANGNCDAGDKMSDEETQLSTYTQEGEPLLKEAEACSSQSQSSNSTDLLTRSDDCSSFESIGPSQSTAALSGPHSAALSEPMTLCSHAESLPPQTSVPMQPPSQSTSPHVISPTTTSPHVNVNITFNIGNGSEITQCVTPTSLLQSDCQLPVGEKEETFSIPQQEAGKESVVTVQESTVLCA